MEIKMKHTALLVVDVQEALVKDKPYAIEQIISNIKNLIDACRRNNVEVIYIQHNGTVGDELEPNSDGWRIYHEICPTEDETVITKNYNSAFKETCLKEYLNEKGIEQLIVTGMQTEYCIDTTCKVAFEYGYKLIIPEMTNTTYDNGSIQAKDLYEYYNYRIFSGRFGTVEGVEKTLQRITE